MDAAEFSDLCEDAESDARKATRLFLGGDLTAALIYADLSAAKKARIHIHLATQERIPAS